MNSINTLNNFSKYIINFNIYHFINEFYNITKPDITKLIYIIENVNRLLDNPSKFWLLLDDDDKNKFINIIISYDLNKEYDIELPENCKISYTYSNGKKNYKLINNNNFNYNNSDNNSNDSDNDSDNNSNDSDELVNSIINND
jgi:hypothetical protein